MVSGGQSGKDRRRHARRSMVRTCKARHAEGVRYALAQTQDISESGALLWIQTPRPLSPGQSLAVAIDFEGRCVLTRGQMLEAKVVRAGPLLNGRQSVAVTFHSPCSMPSVAAVA